MSFLPDLSLAAPSEKPAAKAAKKRTVQHADRGRYAEGKVHEALRRWAEGQRGREFNRLLDTRAAQRIVKSAPADFDFYADGVFGLIEVKETKHEYRLARAKVPQLPRLAKRARCGGLCFVLVYHSTLHVWRCLSIETLDADKDCASWDLRGDLVYATPTVALAATFPQVFGDAE